MSYTFALSVESKIRTNNFTMQFSGIKYSGESTEDRIYVLGIIYSKAWQTSLFLLGIY